MATIDAAIRAYLRADLTVAALVHERIHPEQRPQGEQFPAIAYSTSSTPAEDLKEHSGLTFTEFDFVCMATTANEAEEVAQAVRSVLDGVSNAERDGHTFSARYVRKTSGLFASVDGSESGIHYRIVTIEVAHAT